MSWTAPGRGSVPISWGVNPRIGREFPALLQFYAATARSNDSFFAGCSGNGYAYPFNMADNFPAYASQAGAQLRAYGPGAMDVWPQNPRIDTPCAPGGCLPLDDYVRYQSYANKSITLFTQPPTANNNMTNLWLADGTPLLQTTNDLFYPNLDPKVSLHWRRLQGPVGSKL